MFALCLKKLNMAAEEVCYIGDSLTKDIEGAMAAGMRAVRFYPEKPSAVQYKMIADSIISNIEYYSYTGVFAVEEKE